MATVKQLTDREFFLAYIESYLNGELLGDLETRMSSLIANDKFSRLTNEFGIAKGRFQLDLAEISLNETDIHELRTLVEGDAERAEHEASKIDRLGRAEIIGGVLRRVIFVGGLIVLGIIGIHYLSPKEKPKFNPLDTLVYEAITMEEDSEGRLDFISSDLGETIDYMRAYPDLGFSILPLNGPGNGWILDGGSVIDYDVAKIAAFQFRNASVEEKIFLFLFKGSLDDLPKTDVGNHQGMLYHTYASELVNVVVWKADDPQGLLGMLVGSLGAQELANVAKTTTRL